MTNPEHLTRVIVNPADPTADYWLPLVDALSHGLPSIHPTPTSWHFYDPGAYYAPSIEGA